MQKTGRQTFAKRNGTVRNEGELGGRVFKRGEKAAVRKTAIKKAARLATNRLLRQLKPLESSGLREQTQLSSLQSIFS